MKAGLLVLWVIGVQTCLAPEAAGLDSEQLLIQEIAESGRCADLPQNPESRALPPSLVAPGLPPVLSFRYYEGKLHHGFENTDLMLDDASH